MRRPRFFAPEGELGLREAYALWAPTYGDEPDNPLMRIEQEAMVPLWPSLAGQRVLDLGCGSGRYLKRLRAAGGRVVVGLDLTPAMLRRSRRFASALTQGQMAALPFPAASFDLVICSLVIGHEPWLAGAVGEMARVLRPGGVALYSDMHPDAARRGWRRTFTAPSGRLHELPHYVHDRAGHLAACSAAGLHVEQVAEPVVDFDHPDRGRPAILVVRARRAPADREGAP
jgi:malonyl-CoA O-methyltransferase